MARRAKGCCAGCVAIIVVIAAAGMIVARSLAPTAKGSPKLMRFEKVTLSSRAMSRLESEGIVQSAWAANVYAKLLNKANDVQPGTYRLVPGSTLDEVLAALRKPVSRMVRIPEGWWISRTAARLEREGVCSAEEYVKAATALAKEENQETLEGKLFPDTYNFPPLTRPDEIVRTQYRTYQRKVVEKAPANSELDRALIVASMVELEAAKDEERPRIAGVIENRLAKGIPLEIDATVLYALQEWKELGPGVVRTVKSPYNTYLNKGLPPGPIGSPSWKSVQAALKPEKHGYLYYVARPNRSHYFSASYPEHLSNIRKARAEWRASR